MFGTVPWHLVGQGGENRGTVGRVHRGGAEAQPRIGGDGRPPAHGHIMRGLQEWQATISHRAWRGEG